MKSIENIFVLEIILQTLPQDQEMVNVTYI